MYRVYRVMHAAEVLGTSCLELRDPLLGMTLGAFVPAPAFETVRSVFATFDQAARAGAPDEEERLLTVYYQARDALGLTLVTQEGVTVPTEWIHISATEPGEHEVEAHITDPSFFT